MQLANPLHYPVAVLGGAIVLVAGVRLLNLPPVVIIPVAASVAIAGATFRQTQIPVPLNLNHPALEQELRLVQQQATTTAAKATALRTEAAQLLTRSDQIELLAAVQYACDRAHELPNKVEQLTRRIAGSDSLLAVNELQHQLAAAQTKLQSSSGSAQTQLNQLIASLQRNIQLAQQGQDARQAQVVSLSTLITDSAGMLQQMQNQLRSANLQDVNTASELRSLTDNLKSFQENVDLLLPD
jgi:chromosome segregation ATPase